MAIVVTLLIAFILSNAPEHEVLFFIIMILIYTSAFLLHLKFVVGKTEWKVDNEGVTITWIKKIPFANYKDLHLPWTHIKNIQRRVSRREHSINIFLSNGAVIKYYHNEMVRKDDVEDFLNTIDYYCE